MQFREKRLNKKTADNLRLLNWKDIEILCSLNNYRNQNSTPSNLRSLSNQSVPLIKGVSWFYIRHSEDVPVRKPLMFSWSIEMGTSFERLTWVQITFCVQEVNQRYITFSYNAWKWTFNIGRVFIAKVVRM